MRGRVQINDLERPERIQPAPLQSDTYAKPAQPPIDNSLEQLSNALGIFGKGVMSFAAKEEAGMKKAAEEEALARYAQYISATERKNVYEDFVSGRTSFLSDPFTAKVAKQDYARMGAERLAEELDREALPWGTEGWNPEKTILEKAAPYVEKFSNDKDLMLPFRAHLDQIRSSSEKRHIATRGQIQQEYMEDRTRQVFGDIIKQAVTDGLPPQAIVSELRKQYKALGPRESGGLYGMSYKKQDELFLDTLEGLADNPRVAALIPDILFSEREDLNNAGVRLGSLAFANEKKARTIFEKSQKVLGKAAGEDFKTRVRIADVTALEANDGTAISRLATDAREKNPFSGEDTVISKDERRDQAVETFIQRNSANPERIFDVLSKHNIKHPTMFAELEAGFSGFGGTNIQTDHPQAGTPQYEAILKGAQQYRMLADKNYAYVSQHLSKEAIAFYETFNSLTRNGGENVGSTIAGMAAAAARRQKSGKSDMDDGLKREFNDAASKIDLKPWWPGGSPGNEFAVRSEINDLAKNYVLIGGMSPKAALEHAAARLSKSLVAVHGNAITGVPGITPQDGPLIEQRVTDIFKTHKNVLKAEGIDDPKQLSVIPQGPGKFVVVHATTGFPISVAEVKDGKTGVPMPAILTVQELHQLRAQKSLMETEKAWAKAKGKAFEMFGPSEEEGRKGPKPTPNPFAPNPKRM